jgi:hypothetical protein
MMFRGGRLRGRSEHGGGKVIVKEKKAATEKRLNVSLSERAYSDLLNASHETRRSMTELVRLGIGLVRIALETERNGHRLVVATAEGNALKEIVLPS